MSNRRSDDPAAENNGAANGADEEEEDFKITGAERSRIARLQRVEGSSFQASSFTKLLHSAGQSQDFTPFIEYLKSLSPAKADLEIRSLDPRNREGAENELAIFVQALTARLKQKLDFELVNTWMAVFLRLHGDTIEAVTASPTDIGDDEAVNVNLPLQNALSEWKVEQEREGKRLADLVSYCRGIVGFLRSAR